ncbi:MAG: glutathionylspermidine synthase family protein [Alphaproteobacteria bacterium]|nr:glutathionylspermidine synthase family protein [Alphaproteobacteria bacterium]
MESLAAGGGTERPTAALHRNPAVTPRSSAASAGGSDRRPLLSQEGANVTFVENGRASAGLDGPYGAEGFVRQAVAPLPSFDGRRPMCGVWLVASEPAGMCIREDEGAVTTDDACFIPHFILD